MPLKYNPDTGIPYYENPPDIIEIEEGVTPEPIPVQTKKAVFAGDRSPRERRVLDPEAKPAKKQGYGTDGPIPLEKLFGMEPEVEPDDLRYRYATDEEIEEIERLVRERAIPHWPAIIGLINRLRKAEGKL